MKIFTSFFLSIITFFLSTCAPPPPPAPLENNIPADREATFIEIENNVEARINAEDNLKKVEIGEILSVGGSAESGEDSRARLDLIPDGTIIRLAPNSSFTLTELSSDPQSPFTQLELLAGEIWIILSGGELETATSYGTASVRGSMMSVSFDADGAGMSVTCLEGHCALENEAGRVELTEGLASVISAAGQPPSAPEPISGEKVDQWEQANPEVEAWLQGTPIAPSAQNPPPPNDEGGASPSSNLSSKYSLTNNCPEGNWHWQFVGPTTISFSISPGGSESGTLPPGDYTATDSLEGAGAHAASFLPGGGSLTVSACPN